MPKDFYGDLGSGSEHPTPDAIFDAADREFGPFTLDPATALGYHTSDVILDRGGDVVTIDGRYRWSGEVYPLLPAIRVSSATGLDTPWTGRVWLNHPYGKDDWKWIKKARDSVRSGDADLVCALVPVKTQMRWWQRYVIRETQSAMREDNGIAGAKDHELAQGGFERVSYTAADRKGAADIVRFIPGRLRFGDSTTGPEPYSAPFASALIVWRK